MGLGGGGGYPRKKSKKKPFRFSSDAYKALRLINEERNPSAWGVYKNRFKEAFELHESNESLISMLESYFAGDKDILSNSIWRDSDDQEIQKSLDRYLKERDENLQDIQKIIDRINTRYEEGDFS